MARRRRRHHRRYGSYVNIPFGFGKVSLPKLKDLNPLGKSVNSTDVVIGAGVGFVGGAGLRYLVGRFWPTAPEFIQKNLGPISTVLAGAAALALMKNKSRATGIFAGAALTGLAPLGWNFLQKQFPTFFSDYVNVPLGVLTDVPAMGLLVDEGSSKLSGLAAYSMNGAEEEYGLV